MISSQQWRDVGIAVCAAVALAAAFPKIGAAWLVPFGTAALFWLWQGSSWKWAALLGWFAGMVFFSLGFSWMAHTVGAYVGVFGPLIAPLIALFEAPFFAIAAALAVVARKRMHPALAPLASAAAFTVCEWLRSIGILGVPFSQLGYTQADGPLRVFAAYLGTYGVTFALCVIGAYLADALHRRTYRALGASLLAVGAFAALAWWAWPARALPPPKIPVAAIQGNIAQSLKWNNLDLAIDRYTRLTRRAASAHPKLIVWPETVIPASLNTEPGLLQSFLDLSREADATIVAGAVDFRTPAPPASPDFWHAWTPPVPAAYNALYILQPDGSVAIYDKRQLVPFAEWFPGKKFLWWIPYVGSLNGNITPASVDGVYPSKALPLAPLICWESAFSDLAHAQLSLGAQVLVISTDDAWFGTTAGPYMHAQIAQLRAIESGAYVVRAAATGISGIVDPDGSWQARSKMEEQRIVRGYVGPRTVTAFSRIGPSGVALLFILLYAGLLLVPRRA